MKLIKQKFLKFLLLVAMVILSGCAKPIVSESLIPEYSGSYSVISSGPLYQAISVDEVGGGIKTNPMLYAAIDSSELKEAITTSLKRSNYLSSGKESSKYALHVFLVETDLPKSGYITTITTLVKYKLVDIKNDRVVFDEIISASDTKTVDDIFMGQTRIKVTQENAMKKNIAMFLEKLFSINRQ